MACLTRSQTQRRWTLWTALQSAKELLWQALQQELSSAGSASHTRSRPNTVPAYLHRSCHCHWLCCQPCANGLAFSKGYRLPMNKLSTHVAYLSYTTLACCLESTLRRSGTAGTATAGWHLISRTGMCLVTRGTGDVRSQRKKEKSTT